MNKLAILDPTTVPLWMDPGIAVVDKSFQDGGYLTNGDAVNNKPGRSACLKKVK